MKKSTIESGHAHEIKNGKPKWSQESRKSTSSLANAREYELTEVIPWPVPSTLVKLNLKLASTFLTSIYHRIHHAKDTMAYQIEMKAWFARPPTSANGGIFPSRHHAGPNDIALGTRSERKQTWLQEYLRALNTGSTEARFG